MSLRMFCSCPWLRSASSSPSGFIISLIKRRRRRQNGAVRMSAQTPVCELLGIELPIVEAPVAADPRLPAAVSNAGGLGSLGLSWADDAGDVVRATAALTDRPFSGNFVLTVG